MHLKGWSLNLTQPVLERLSCTCKMDFFFTINTYILTRIHGLKKTSSLDKMSRHSTCLILTVLCFLKETRCNRLQPATQTHTTHTPAGPLCMISINRNVKYLSICFQAAETVSHSSSSSPDKSDALLDFLQRTKRKQQQGGLSNCNFWQTFQKWLENEMKWCVFWRLCRYHWLGTVSETLLTWNINSFQGNTEKASKNHHHGIISAGCINISDACSCCLHFFSPPSSGAFNSSLQQLLLVLEAGKWMSGISALKS